MSVLNFPRIYVNGHMFWNPPTANNNDVYPLYDAVKMQMNWPFLACYGITPDNAPTKLLPWMVAPLKIGDVPEYVLEVPGNANPKAYPMIPAEWDLFGDNGCGTVDYQQIKSVVQGGELQANTYIDNDALVNKNYQLLGNPFGSDRPTPARFVDVSPWQNTFTALYFDRLVLGDQTCGLQLNRQYRMLDRFLNFNWGAFDGLNTVTTTWQTCFPRENLQWNVGNSRLLAQLREQMQAQNAQGLMFRFSTYLTFYDRNGIFNNYPPVDTRSRTKEALEKLQAMYEKGLENVADIFFNPAYSRTAGTLGLWFAGEYPTAPAGRRLVPKNAVPVWKTTKGDTAPSEMTLGVISAEVTGDTLSLDLSNSFPFYPIDKNADIPVAAKFQAGSYDLGVNSNGQFTPVASLDYSQYNQQAFDKRSGIVDIALNPQQQQQLQTGALELRLAGTDTSAAIQQMWTAEVVESGSFIDVGDRRTLNIMVQYDGLPAPAGTVLWVAEYNNPFMLTTSNYYLAFSNNADFTLFFNDPECRKNNKPNLPQFTNTSEVSGCITQGSGRHLVALKQAKSTTDCLPVSYRKFLGTPAAVALSPCLKLNNGVAMSGTLQGNSQNIDYQVTKIQTDANGIAQLTINAVAAGFPTLRFFLQEGNQQPQIPFSFNYSEAYIDFMAPLRVLPREPELMQDFINYWNGIYQQQDARQKIWDEYIFAKILRPFYYLYPIMDKYMPLDSLQRVEGAVDQLIVLVSKEYQEESTLAMPITRDLPQSRRAVLELWANKLVKRNYPPEPLSLSDFN